MDNISNTKNEKCEFNYYSVDNINSLVTKDYKLLINSS